MLKRIGNGNENANTSKNRIDEIAIGDATFPRPFPLGLEFNAPVHGTWNIVHIGMQIPESIQIYVCAQNCMRGVVLTAAEMNEADRFSFVILSEKDMVTGDIEEATIQGVIDVIQKRSPKPKAVLLFTVCAHHFLGCDYRRIYRKLEQVFPEIDFFRCYMDPIMQKKGLTPDQKLRRATYEKLPVREPNAKKIALLGSDFLFGKESELFGMIEENGYELGQIKACSSYEEFLQLSEADAFLCNYPPAKVGVMQAADRLHRKFFYFPASFDYDLMDEQINELASYYQMLVPDLTKARERANLALEKAKAVIGDTPIAIDYTVHPRTLGFAKLLLQHGFCVEKIYMDAANGEEEAEFLWLKEHAPKLILSATIHPGKRVTPRGRQQKVLAIGQKAAWFEDTPWFVNVVSGGNLYGYSGVCQMAELMQEAFENKKDTKDIVPRKGWGCESCV